MTRVYVINMINYWIKTRRVCTHLNSCFHAEFKCGNDDLNFVNPEKTF